MIFNLLNLCVETTKSSEYHLMIQCCFIQIIVPSHLPLDMTSNWFYQGCFPINIHKKTSLRRVIYLNVSRLLLKTTGVFISTTLIIHWNFHINRKTLSLGSNKRDSTALDIIRNTLAVQ